MAAFFCEVWEHILTPDFLNRVRQKYHFEEADWIELRTVANQMLPWIRREAFWDRKEYHIQELSRPGPCESSRPIYECVVMTLGPGIDALQESYSDSGLLLKSYMAEVLACEILQDGYQAYEQFLKKTTGLHVAGYHFPGSEAAFPLELLADLIKDYAPHIICNSAFCITPMKSVVFLAELTQERPSHESSICFTCTDKHCPYRIKNHVMRRDFSEEKRDL